MKRLLSLTAKPILTLVIVASVFGPVVPANVSSVHADTPNPNNLNDNRNNLAAGQTTTNPSAYGNTNGTDLQCSATMGIGLAVCVSGFVYWITVGLGSWVAGITAYVFDYAVQLSLVSGAYAFDFINIGWGIVRDVANMSFLFILIYIAFKIMFQAETAGTMRMLVWVVVVALLVNFSFLLTRLVIDAGNIVALQFYNAISAGSPTIAESSSGSGGVMTGGNTKDITSSIMNALNPQAIIGTNGFNNFVQNQNQSAMYYLIVSSIVFILTGVSLFMLAAVFIFAALRFIMRIIGLWFVIIAAPAAFVAAIFRGKEGGAIWFNRWLGYLLEYSFYPAVFLFMFYIEVRFLQEMNGAALFNNIYNATASGQSWTSIAQASASVSIRLGFILSTMYLILRSSQWTGEAFKKVGTTWVQNRLTGLGRSTLKLGTQGALGGVRLATQPIRSGIQSQSNAATRTGINSTLWRSINRAVGGTTQAKPQQFSGAGVGNTYGSALNSILRKQPQATGQTQPASQAQGATQAGQGNAGQNQPQTQPAQANQQVGITNVQTPAIPTGARRLPGGAPITQVQGGDINLPTAGAPLNINAQRAIQGLYRQAAADKIMRGATPPNAQQAQQTARAAAVGINLVTTPPNMNQAKEPRADETRAAAPAEQQVGALRDEIRGLGQSVRDAVAAAKNGTAMPQKVIVSAPTHIESAPQSHTAPSHSNHMSEDDIAKIAKKIAHKLEPSLSHTPEPTPPTSGAPASQAPSPANTNEDLGTMLPKAA